jgi:hypothetical protein
MQEKTESFNAAEDNRFYVYVHRRKDTGEVFYVGKGTLYRLISKHGRSKVWHSVADHCEWVAEKYKDNLTEDEALDLELNLIDELKPEANKHKKDLRKKPIDIVFIRKRYSYDENSPTALVYKEWNGQQGAKRKDVGDVAGTKNGRGYYTVHAGFSGNILAHRVVWCLLNNEDPCNDVVDHIDGDRSNNKVSNLRRVSPADNNRNIGIRKDNTTGVIGVNRTSNGFFTATWSNDRVQGSKTISIAKHGEDLAFELACYIRFKNLTSAFSERHISQFEFKLLKDKTDEEINLLLNDDLIATNSTGISNIHFNEVSGASFWVFKYKREHSKSFSIKKYGYNLAKELAVAYKDRYLTGNCNAVGEFSLSQTLFMLDDETSAANLSGFKGLQFQLNKNGDTIIVAQKMINKKNYTKRFSCNEHGIMKAHMLATQWYLER